MLTIPSTHLVVISFGDPLGRIMKSYKDVIQKSQITLMIGSVFGGLELLVDNFLPKPSIDRTTIKMAELVRVRLNSDHASSSDGLGDEQTDEDRTMVTKPPNDSEPVVCRTNERKSPMSVQKGGEQ